MVERLKMTTEGREELTLCFSLSSLLRGALIMFRRTVDGAEKCALRDLRLDEAMPEDVSDTSLRVRICMYLPDPVFMAAVIGEGMGEVLFCDLSSD